MTSRAQARAPEEGATLSIRHLSKTFGSNRALDDVELTVQPGEVHVLAGANGSGKSTLIKILSGYYEPDSGAEVVVDGSPLAFGSPTSTYHLGCRFVHQDLGLIANLSVLDNLSLTAGYPTRLGTIRTGAAKKGARAALAAVGLEKLPLGRSISRLTAAERTAVAVARAIRADQAHPVKLLVLDEPTATMPVDDVEHLLSMIRSIAASGVAILLVTHHLDEVFRVADRITVLRDGRHIATTAIEETDQARLVEQLTGDVTEPTPVERSRRVHDDRPVLEVGALAGATLRPSSFAVQGGEIVGLAGIDGSGREVALSLVFGRLRSEAGEVLVEGRPVPVGRPDASIRAGVAYLPADRKVNGGIMELSARENISLANLRPFWRGGRLCRGAERAEALRWFTQLRVRPAQAIGAPLSSFSGGNQQKILFGKWIRHHPQVFLLDEPTQGVDVGAKAELHRQLLELADAGTAVVVSSTDLEELAAICDRVLIFRGGRIAEELVEDRVTATEINRSCLASSTENEVAHA